MHKNFKEKYKAVYEDNSGDDLESGLESFLYNSLTDEYMDDICSYMQGERLAYSIVDDKTGKVIYPAHTLLNKERIRNLIYRYIKGNIFHLALDKTNNNSQSPTDNLDLSNKNLRNIFWQYVPREKLNETNVEYNGEDLALGLSKFAETFPAKNNPEAELTETSEQADNYTPLNEAVLNWGQRRVNMPGDVDYKPKNEVKYITKVPGKHSEEVKNKIISLGKEVNELGERKYSNEDIASMLGVKIHPAVVERVLREVKIKPKKVIRRKAKKQEQIKKIIELGTAKDKNGKRLYSDADIAAHPDIDKVSKQAVYLILKNANVWQKNPRKVKEPKVVAPKKFKQISKIPEKIEKVLFLASQVDENGKRLNNNIKIGEIMGCSNITVANILSANADKIPSVAVTKRAEPEATPHKILKIKGPLSSKEVKQVEYLRNAKHMSAGEIADVMNRNISNIVAVINAHGFHFKRGRKSKKELSAQTQPKPSVQSGGNVDNSAKFNYVKSIFPGESKEIILKMLPGFKDDVDYSKLIKKS